MSLIFHIVKWDISSALYQLSYILVHSVQIVVNYMIIKQIVCTKTCPKTSKSVPIVPIFGLFSAVPCCFTRQTVV